MIYLAGFLVLVLGLTLGLHLIGLPNTWIAVAGIVMLGIGIITGVTHMRRRDASPME
jgi:hypothetical protein